jgi:hypothetical protein
MPREARSAKAIVRRVIVELGPALVVEDDNGAVCVVPTGCETQKRDVVAALMVDFGVSTIADLNAAVATLVRPARDKLGRVHEARVQREWAKLRQHTAGPERCSRCGSLRLSGAAAEPTFRPFDLETDAGLFEWDPDENDR